MKRRTQRISVLTLAVVSSLAVAAQMPATSKGVDISESAPTERAVTPEGTSTGSCQSGITPGCCQPGATDSASVVNKNSDAPEPGCDPVRFQQAKFLIETGRSFIEVARPLHERMQEQILIAETLKGRANMLMNKIRPAAPPKLQGKALEAAKDDYLKSLQAFVNNADKYQLNLHTFQSTIGECQRAQTAYDQQRNLYDLHCDQFHVRDLAMIPAPHICGELNLTQSEASGISGQLRADEQRLSQTMAELNQTNGLVRESRNLVETNLTNTATKAVRLQEEEKLAKQFGRLREEYEFLKIQSKILGADNQKTVGKLIQRSVSGTVVNKK